MSRATGASANLQNAQPCAARLLHEAGDCVTYHCVEDMRAGRVPIQRFENRGVTAREEKLQWIVRALQNFAKVLTTTREQTELRAEGLICIEKLLGRSRWIASGQTLQNFPRALRFRAEH